MNSDREILSRTLDVPFHRLFRATGRPVTAPLELCFAVTYKCANRCRTCNSISRSDTRELAPEEYSEVFKRISFSPLSVTITGGEPFLRDDLPNIAFSCARNLRPGFMFVETCGDTPELVTGLMHGLSKTFPRTRFIAMLSMDGAQENMDWMRGGAKGSFSRFLETFRTLKTMSSPNLAVAIRVTVSKYNQDTAAGLINDAFMIYPDAVALDFAGPAKALGVTDSTVPDSPAPDAELLREILETYKKLAADNRPAPGTARLLSALFSRRATMKTSSALTEKGKPPTCFAGFSYLYIDPAGAVMDCPGAARELGALPGNNFNLEQILDSKQAAITRGIIKKSECKCTAAWPMFSNVFLTPSGCANLAAASI